MDAIEIIVTEDVKRASIRETLNRYIDSMATLCYAPETGRAEVRIIRVDDEICGDIIQVIDLSENAAYGSYIDSLVDPDARLRIPGNPGILALWGNDDDPIDGLVDDYVTMLGAEGDVDWDGWVKDNTKYLYTIDDAAFDIWELVIEDIEYDGRYIVVEE